MQSIVDWMTEILAVEHWNTRGILAEQPGMKMPEPIRRDTPASPRRDGRGPGSPVCVLERHHMEALDRTYRDSTGSAETDHDMPSLPGPWRTPGTVVMWESPVLGLINGEVLRIHGHGDVDVYHPVAEGIVRIPRTWMRR
jgi:hypothetical protein